MTERKGSKTSNRAAILRRPITAGGFGRRLTVAECRDLLDLGWSCSTRWIVVRQGGDIPYLGSIYQPAPQGGFAHAGIYVETRD